jgi:DNA-binding NarL/FixJ family response regulator
MIDQLCAACFWKPIMPRPRVLLADDHRMLREAFTQLLEPQCDIVGQCADGRALLEAAATLYPDIIVLDIGMPLLNGLDAARQLKRNTPDVKLIFLTVSEDPEVAAEAFRIGASGYLLKNSAVAELLQAIDEVQQGHSFVTPLLAKGLMQACLHERPHPSLGDRMSPRQREVLQLLAEGYTMKEIAGILHITPRTVAFHKYSLMHELGIKSSAELVRFGVKQGVVSE